MTKLKELIEEFEKSNGYVQNSNANNHYKAGYEDAVEKFREIADDIYEQDLEVLEQSTSEES